MNRYLNIKTLLFTTAFLLTSTSTIAWSPRCSLGITKCVKIQGKDFPRDEAEKLIDSCRDFTRNNLGNRVLKMSVQEVFKISNKNISHPLLRAWLAYDDIQDSSLDFDRNQPIEKRYFSVKNACRQVFKSMNTHSNHEDDEDDEE